MAVIELNHYNLRAPLDLLDELRDFYCKALELNVGARPPFRNFGYWLYAGDRPLLHLSEADAGEEHLRHVCGTFDHVAFTCRDFAGTRARLDRLGISYRLADVPATRQRQVFFDDPAGNGIELNFTLADARS